MRKLPIESVLEMRAMFEPIMREQLRGVLAAHALQGTLASGRGYTRPDQAADAAVDYADKVLQRLYPEGESG